MIGTLERIFALLLAPAPGGKPQRNDDSSAYYFELPRRDR